MVFFKNGYSERIMKEKEKNFLREKYGIKNELKRLIYKRLIEMTILDV